MCRYRQKEKSSHFFSPQEAHFVNGGDVNPFLGKSQNNVGFVSLQRYSLDS